jgi:L-lactate dehydrogenase complex protein LldG
VSLARAAAAECGTILLDSTEGRRLQLLPPVHLVWLPRSAIAWSLRAALMAARLHHGAALGLHSGPSKSADIGGVLVRGVHGPGRLVAALVPEGVFRTGDGQDSRDDR